MNTEEYPKEKTLRNGTTVQLRPMVAGDEEGLMEFFTSLPEKERLYLRNDVINPEVIRFWVRNIDYDSVLPVLALSDGFRIVGVGTLHRNANSWNSHIGSIRLSVRPDFRRHGLARILAGELFANALMTDLEKIVAEIIPQQEDVRLAFNQLGFQTEAVLKDHHRDARGKKHDVIIISSDINQLWKRWMEYCDSVSGVLQKEY